MEDVFNEIIELHKKSLKELEDKKDIVLKIAEIIHKAIKNGNKILICGNGGSAADSQHFAAELVGRFTRERKAYPAIALTTDTSIITSISNDYSFEKIFERQIEALGKNGDILIGFSTSGKSKNIISAFKKAKENGITTIAILGSSGELYNMADISFTVQGSTARVQEIHSIVIHIICEIVESLQI
ncbi:MAG: SIS domain-containing protein [Elusimicrobia bacterium]|jgi:D-sedoheptulose 7-phosphate isomerase|nr:SIS domain-containing protein [Elusimicrobiota bacterium]